MNSELSTRHNVENLEEQWSHTLAFVELPGPGACTCLPIHTLSGSVHWTCLALGTVLDLRSGYSFMGEEIPADRYGEFQHFLDAIQIRDMRVIEVGKKEGNGGKTTPTRAEGKSALKD